MEIPIYDIKLDDNDYEFQGMTCISIVQEPAMETELLFFNKENKSFSFEIVQDTMEHCINGVLILADTPIYRYSSTMGEYYVKFTKETIKQLAEKYVKDNLLNTVSLHHNGQLINGLTLREFYIKDVEKGINPTSQQFSNVPDGSLFCTFHVTDDKLWNEIQTLGGFSIELLSDIELSQMSAKEFDPLEYIFKKIVTKGDIKDVLDSNRKVNITVGQQVLEQQQIYQLGKEGDLDVVVTFDPKTTEWYSLKLNQIDALELTDIELDNFVYNASWKTLQSSPSLVVTDTKPSSQKGKNSIDFIIDNNLYAMISYDDEEEGGATGYRTCFISSWGYTTAGNECIRIYEYAGASRSGLANGRWRLLLTRRIIDLKSIDYAEPIKIAPPQFNGERKAGTGINGTMERIKRVSTLI